MNHVSRISRAVLLLVPNRCFRPAMDETGAGDLGLVVSHPFDRKNSKGWGTEVCFFLVVHRHERVLKNSNPWSPTLSPDQPSDEDLSAGTPVRRKDGARRFGFWLALPCLFVFAFIFSGCRGKQPAASNSLTPVRLQLDWYPQPEHGGFFAAQLLGYYKAEGLEVTIVPLPLYASVAQQVASGKADFGLGSSDQILEWNSNGLPLVAVAATMQHDPQAVMVHKNSPIHDFKDLEGHTIAAQTGATWLKYVISRYNLHQVKQIPSTLSVANFLADSNYVQQIFITSEPFFAKQAGAECPHVSHQHFGIRPLPRPVHYARFRSPASRPGCEVCPRQHARLAALSQQSRPNQCPSALAQSGPQPRAGSLHGAGAPGWWVCHRRRSEWLPDRQDDRNSLASRL